MPDETTNETQETDPTATTDTTGAGDPTAVETGDTGVPAVSDPATTAAGAQQSAEAGDAGAEGEDKPTSDPYKPEKFADTQKRMQKKWEEERLAAHEERARIEAHLKTLK